MPDTAAPPPPPSQCPQSWARALLHTGPPGGWGGLWVKSQKAFLGSLTSRDHMEQGLATPRVTCLSPLHRVTWNPYFPSRRTTEAEFSSVVGGAVGSPQQVAGDWPMTAEAICLPSGQGDWYVGQGGGANVLGRFQIHQQERAVGQVAGLQEIKGAAKTQANPASAGSGPAPGDRHTPHLLLAQAPALPGSAAAMHGNGPRASGEVLETAPHKVSQQQQPKAKSLGLGQK